MRHSCKFLILLLSLIITANSSYAQYRPKYPPQRVERPEISFELVQASDGVIKIRMTNDGNKPFRFQNSFTPRYPYRPDFRLCDRPFDACSEANWINPDTKSSSAIFLPAELSELEPGGSIENTVQIRGMLAGGGVYDPDPSARLKIKFDVMLTPYLEEYIEYVSDWIPVETLMRP